MLSMGREKAVNSSKTYSSRSFKTNEDSSVLCPYCKSSQEDLKGQISQLKEKAHQSFMQVLQIQQLHEEEINQMREQWEEKERELLTLVSTLQEEVKIIKTQMQQLEKNVQRHNYDFGVKELVFDNIESIGCQDDDRSYLDESSLIQFRELLTVKNANDYVATLRKQIYKDFKFISNNKTQIEKLFIVIKELKDQNSQLHKINELHKEKIAKTEAHIKETKATLESSHRENKFISQNLKRLGNDKLNLQKKISELQKAKGQDEVQSPSSLKQRMGSNREDSSQKTDKMMEILHQVSQLSLTTSKRQINELNYAKFMGPDQIEGDISPTQFKSRRSSNEFKGSPTDFNIRRSPFRKMIN